MSSNIAITLPDDDDKAIGVIVQYLKSEGIFDSLRKECLDDMDQKSAFMTQTHKIEEFVKRYCDKTDWNPTLNKNQYRERLRRTLDESGMMKWGVERLVDDAVAAKEHSFFEPIEKVVRDILGVDHVKQEQEDHNHNNSTGVIDMEIDDQDEDMDRGEQDMELSDVEDTGRIEPQGIESRIESFVRSFREVPSSQPLECKPDPHTIQQLICSIPFPSAMPSSTYATASQSPGSPNELQAPMYSPIRPDEDDAFVKIEPPCVSAEISRDSPAASAGQPVEQQPIAVLVKQEKFSPKDEPVPQLAPLPPKLLQIKQEPEEAVALIEKQRVNKKRSPEETISNSRRDAAVKEIKRQQPTQQHSRPKSGSKNKKKEPIVKQETVVKQEEEIAKKESPELEEILSDVSSVHTSDLSDYDDRISISSGGEETEEKRKISLQEVRKLEDEVKKGNEKQAKKKKTAVKTRRERKINPKYASEDYSSSIYNKKTGSFLEEEDIDSEEDFDQQLLLQQQPSVKEQSLSPPDDSSSFIDMTPKAAAAVSATTKKNMDPESSENTGSPSLSKPVKKKVPRKVSERYDASDLYKPRPMIGSSRRNRSQPGGDT